MVHDAPTDSSSSFTCQLVKSRGVRVVMSDDDSLLKNRSQHDTWVIGTNVEIILAWDCCAASRNGNRCLDCPSFFLAEWLQRRGPKHLPLLKLRHTLECPPSAQTCTVYSAVLFMRSFFSFLQVPQHLFGHAVEVSPLGEISAVPDNGQAAALRVQHPCFSRPLVGPSLSPAGLILFLRYALVSSLVGPLFVLQSGLLLSRTWSHALVLSFDSDSISVHLALLEEIHCCFTQRLFMTCCDENRDVSRTL